MKVALPQGVEGDDTLFRAVIKLTDTRHEPGLRVALVTSWRAARAHTDGLEAKVRSQSWAGIASLLNETNERATRAAAEPRLSAAFLRGVSVGMRPLRRLTLRSVKRPLRFDMAKVNPFAARWARERTGELLNDPDDTVALVRDFVEQAVEGDLTVDEVAKVLRTFIGLDSRRAEYVGNYARTLREQGMTGDDYDQSVERYVSEQIKSRASTIARTEVMKATNAGQQMVWEEAIDQGILSSLAMKIWIVTDDYKCCEECIALQEAGPVGIDDEFDDGVDFPPLHPNCRCTIGLVREEPVRDEDTEPDPVDDEELVDV